MKKVFIIIFLSLFVYFLLPIKAFAADLNIECFGTGTCTKTGMDPLFSVALDGYWLPGNSASKTFKLTNSASQIREAFMKPLRTSDAGILEDVIEINLSPSGGGTPNWSGILTDFYNLGNFSLGNIPSGGNAEFVINARMKPEAGNEYQAKSTIFDLNFSFWVEENPLVQGTTLVKTNDKQSASAGDTVTYTLTLTNGLIPLTNIEVKDSLPTGFTYVAGSTAGASEPTVSGNTLNWTIDSLAGGATATITYQAKIDSSQQAGTYYNLATCRAITNEDQTVNCGMDDSPVTVGQSFSFSSIVGGSVLGVSIGRILGAATGSETYWLVLAIALIIGGFLLINRKRFIK